ncbi:hypothetical protein [Pedobacter alpinus]|uniref:Addiction module component n=1 Tax=Pedobacter alpinus TaxID=1590643 RepID=A0ABW5TU61_9SPHI
MESLTIEIINPKAKKLLQDLADMNLINIFENLSTEEVHEEQWDSLTKEQQDGILEAVESINAGNGIPHEEVITKMRKKLLND